jgi:DNA polymerase (family 10)
MKTPTALRRLEVVAALRDIAALMKLRTGDPFRSAAYAKAASVIAEYDGDLEPLIQQKRLTEIKGIGKSLAGVIEELFLTGNSSLLERLKEELPPGALVLAKVGLTLSRIEKLYETLGIASIDDLRSAIEAGMLRSVPGFGEKTEASLLARISKYENKSDDILLVHALESAKKAVDYLQLIPEAEQVDIAGAMRRWKETVSDIRITAMAGTDASQLVSHFLKFPLIAEIESQNEGSATVQLLDGMVVTLSIAGRDQYWNLLHHETGAEAHLKRLQEIATEKRIDLTRLTMRSTAGRRVLEVHSEEDIYKHLGMQYVPPELREDVGEIEAALSSRIPDDLIAIDDIMGMVHCHTTYSDGRNSLEEMARAAEAMGMKYMTITDHSPTAHYAGGLSVERLKQQWDEISEVQEKVSIKLLRGTESDILREGELDYPDDVLEKFDVIIASIHNRYKLDEDQMTNRVINAMKNPFFKIWGHPLGRLVQRRPPIDCRVEEILDAIAASGAAIEISADPHRLDMEPRWAREARKRGTKFVISTDAHSVSELQNLKFGVGIARRAGVRRGEVLNTLCAEAFSESVRPAK